MNAKKKKFAKIIGICLTGLLLIIFLNKRIDYLSHSSEPHGDKNYHKTNLNPPHDNKPIKNIDNSTEQKPMSSSEINPAIKNYTAEELKVITMMVINYDGTINPEFFEKFGFTAEQKNTFSKIWADNLDTLQRIETYRITEEVSEPGTTKFWISEFPEVGGELKKTLTKSLEGKIPEQARKFFLEINEQDIRYTFSNFGKYRRSFNITQNNGDYEMIESFFHVSEKGLTLTGWRKHLFKTPPSRFQRLLTDKAN